jgi:hypothetical protein
MIGIGELRILAGLGVDLKPRGKQLIPLNRITWNQSESSESKRKLVDFGKQNHTESPESKREIANFG